MNRRLEYLTFIVLILIRENKCLNEVTISAESWLIHFNQDVTLYCNYDLQNKKLYSVKWYRGTYEFYRYEPSSTKPAKTFPLYNIKVNLDKSNATQVTLQQVGYELDGNVSCEVTPEVPYREKKGVAQLFVISPPKYPPVIKTDKEVYKINETLSANCTTSLSYPSTTLIFYANDNLMEAPQQKIIPCNQSVRGMKMVLCEYDKRTSWSWLPINLTLDNRYFTSNNLVLNCTESLPGTNITKRSTKLIQLSTVEPKPERVRSPNYSSRLHSKSDVVFVVFSVVALSSIFQPPYSYLI